MMAIRRLLPLVWLLCAISLAHAETELTIGVLAFREKAQTLRQWQPLATYLESRLPGRHFALQALTYDELENAIARRQVDFVFTHAAHYVRIGHGNSLSSALATVIEREHGQPMPVYGGAIVVRSDRSDITKLADLKGRTIATSTVSGFASYQMQAYELFKVGLSIPEDVRIVEVGLPIDRAVDAIFDGRADAAFARMGLIEQMTREGKLDPARIKVLNEQKLAGFDYAFSTTLYPLWPFAAMPQVSDELAAQVAAALLMMPHDGEAARAMNIWGFTIPANYQPVEEVMQALRMPPFDEVPEFSWKDVWQRYRPTISLAIAASGVILMLMAWLALSRRRLRESEQQLRTLVESAPDAIVVANAWGLIAGWNEGAQRLFGYSRDEAMGEPLTRLMPARYRARHLAGMERIHAGEPARQAGQLLEVEGLRKDGSEFPLEMVMGSWNTASGRLFSAIIRDISERRRVSAELEEYRNHLEELVQLRTAELASARDAAEDANRAKSVFLANMSHELRTPLNAILGFAQILERDTRIPDDERRNIATINRSGNHLLSLINDVLAISRIEVGRIAVTNQPFDLRAALTAVEEMIRGRAEAKGLAFGVECSDDLPRYVLGDAHHLSQVLLNLLGNAVKYTERGEVRLTVTAMPGQMLRFAVIDTGPGIAPEEHEKIFHAFYQTEAGVAKGEGAGLGLTISREFVRLMGGELAVDSIPGQGSTFGFTIPLPPNEAIPCTTRDARIVGLAAGQPTPRILVAEDQPDNQQVVEQLLKLIGFQVRIAANGQEAVDLYQSWQPQLILMDMRMPVMDGYEATRIIRTLPGGERIPIVALTASAFEEDRSQVLAAGCDEMVKKPIEENQFFEVIGRTLGLRFEYAEAPPAAPAIVVARSGQLDALAAELRQALAAAALALDRETTMEIVGRLRADHPAEARLITELVEGYRYDLLLEQCGGQLL
jgi:PAS domain S-box-containing protein